VLEIETTSPTGFDWIHDERFYRERAASWSGQRGLRPVTLEEYSHRTIVEPYQLMAEAMIDSYQGEDDATHLRRNELAGVIYPDSAEMQKRRIQVYDHEAHDLFERKAGRTMVSLFDTVRPAVNDIGAKSKDAQTLEMVS